MKNVILFQIFTVLLALINAWEIENVLVSSIKVKDFKQPEQIHISFGGKHVFYKLCNYYSTYINSFISLGYFSLTSWPKSPFHISCQDSRLNDIFRKQAGQIAHWQNAPHEIAPLFH